MLYILWGPDDFTLSQALGELKKEADTGSVFSAGITTVDGCRTTPDYVRSVCNAAPFLSGKRLVIIYGLLERFEPKGKHERERRTGSVEQEGEYQSYTAVLEQTPDTTDIALVEGQLSGNNPLFKELSRKRVMIKAFPLLKDAPLRLWIQKQAKDAGGSISSQATDSLIKIAGSNLWAIHHEIEKLVLFTDGRRIEESDVNTLVSHTEQSDIFSMVDAIIAQKPEIASRRMQSLLRKGAAPTYLVFMLCRQVRLMVRARELNKQGASQAEIQARLGITASFGVRKTMEQSSRYSLAKLKEVYHTLLASDLAIKTGMLNGELTVMVLVAELCRSPQPPAAKI